MNSTAASLETWKNPVASFEGHSSPGCHGWKFVFSGGVVSAVRHV